MKVRWLPIASQQYCNWFTWECTKCALPNVSSSFFSLSDQNLSNAFSLLDIEDDLDVFEHGEFTTNSPKQVHSSQTKGSTSTCNGDHHADGTISRNPGSIKVPIVNCRGLKSERKKIQFLDLFETHKPDVILGQESHINSTYSDTEVFLILVIVFQERIEIVMEGVSLLPSQKDLSPVLNIPLTPIVRFYGAKLALLD